IFAASGSKSMPSAAQGITSRTGTTLSSEDGATRGSRGQGNRANRQRGVSGCLRRNSRSPGTYGPTDIVADSPPKSGPGFAHFERGIAPIDSSTCADLLALSGPRSEEHTSELQSRSDLVCRLLLEKKKDISDTNVLD